MKYAFRLATANVNREGLIEMLRAAANLLEKYPDLIGSSFCDIEGAHSGLWEVDEIAVKKGKGKKGKK